MHLRRRGQGLRCPFLRRRTLPPAMQRHPTYPLSSAYPTTTTTTTTYAEPTSSAYAVPTSSPYAVPSMTAQHHPQQRPTLVVPSSGAASTTPATTRPDFVCTTANVTEKRRGLSSRYVAACSM
ncbi:hypothetical protein C8J57DRAFT_1722734 [Mycena rebaudengoi]|nr:hypothetical protein C8J57DRAFT_1722734 [Mycena rebaudengoi]